MALLLDTRILIWLMEGDSLLTAKARKSISTAERLLVSSASVWEIAIKARIGKLRVDVEWLILRMTEAGIDELTVTNRHAAATAKLPLLHNDPFDRLLIAQSMMEPVYLLTADAQLKAYSELVILA